MSTPLPPGQALTRKFPQVGEAAPAPGLPEPDAGQWTCRIEGLVQQPLRLGLAELRSMPQQSFERDIHCVTGWSRLGTHFTGVPLRMLLEQARPAPEAAFVRFIAHSPRAHDTSLPLDVALTDCWLVHSVDGAPLSVDHGGPLRSLTPSRYFYKSLKWLCRIELLAADAPGYWERESAYHNDADPWQEQRFDDARTATREESAALKAAADFADWRGRTVIKARLGGWEPASRDLSGLSLKACSLRNAQLRGCRLAGANLSLSNLEGADLREADFSHADLEGASFAGADLRGALMSDTALSATRFFRDFPNGKRLAAQVEGLCLQRVSGLLEEQQDFLRAAGARFD